MKNSIVIGPIKRSVAKVNRKSVLNERLSKMKVGNFFEVTGLATKQDVVNFRGSVGYFSKKNNIRVITKMEGNTLIVERVKSSKTKETSEVK
jgi:hypothetical protein